MKMNVTVANQTIEVEIGDLNTRPIMAKIGDETFEVWPEDKAASAKIRHAEGSATRIENCPAAHPTRQPAPTEAPASGSTTIAGKTETAPLPGVVINIAVKPGNAVKPGQALMDIEAMKMKNTICASTEGVVAEILVSVGYSVCYGQILLKYV